MKILEVNGMFFPDGFDNPDKSAGWFAFFNWGARHLDFLMWCYEEDYLKLNPHIEREDAKDIVKHQILFDFQRIHKSSLNEISILAKEMYGDGAYSILEENPNFGPCELNTISECLQKRA